MNTCALVIIGGGPAGLSAAVAAYDAGVRDLLILERDSVLGGILNQCIHNGFGLHTFKEELTGPEYAQRYIDLVEERGIPYKLNTMVLDISPEKVITTTSRADGIMQIRAKAVVLAMGCRERSRGALNIPGFRPAGIFSAGTAQRLVNIEGYMPGRRVVILGSGDIGLIMARRMTLEGAKVLVCAELMPYSGGLKRNIVQCLDDFDIPLKLSHTVIDIEGRERVEAVTIAEVGPDRRPIPGTEERYECDTLLLSVGLIPENELSRGMGVTLSPVTNGPVVNESLETSIPGVFAAGNVLHVHDLVDYVSEEAGSAGRAAAEFIAGTSAAASAGKEHQNANTVTAENADKEQQGTDSVTAEDAGKEQQGADSVSGSREAVRTKTAVPITFEGGPRYTVPAFVRPSRVGDQITIRYRVGSVMRNREVGLYLNGEKVLTKKRTVMAPGEMEELILKKTVLDRYPELTSILIRIEEGKPAAPKKPSGEEVSKGEGGDAS